MSLSFVTKAIQTTAADGTFEEQEVVNADNDKSSSSRSTNGIGLFDQLRQNKEEEEASRLEYQRSLMRGTLALDEDDVAHLQQLEKLKNEAVTNQIQETESELASFRAAQAERLDQTNAVSKTSYTSDSFLASKDTEQTRKEFLVPKIKIQTRKRRQIGPISDTSNGKSDELISTETTKKAKEDVLAEPHNPISTLLNGYSSEDD